MANKRGRPLKLGLLNIILLGLVSLLNDFGSEMIMPILPLFITSLGGTGMAIGLIGGLMEGFPNILKIFSGYLSDKLKKRKLFIFLGYLNSELFKLLLVFSKTWTSILIFMGLEKAGKGIREAPRDALISESMPKTKGKGFGIQRAFDTAGAILGSVAVLLLFLFLKFDFRTIILIAAIIGFLALIPLYFVKEIKTGETPRNPEKFFLSLKELPKSFKLFILIASLFSLANFSYMFFILKASSLFPFDSSTAIATSLLLYVFFNVFYASFAIPFGRLSDKIGRKKVLIAGYFLFSIVCFGFLLFNSLISYIILFILYGLTYALVVGNQRALVSDISPEQLRATALGIFQTVIGIAAIVSSLIAGYLFDINSSFTFVYGALISLVSVASFLFFGRYFKE